MTKQFNRGDKAFLYVTFLSSSGSPNPSVISPTITIQHDIGAGIVTDVSAQPLIQIGTSNKYYYEYDIPGDAPLTVYYVVYDATVDSITIEGDETYQVQELAGTGGGIE